MTAGAIAIRAVGPEAAATLAAVEAASFDAPWTADALRGLFGDGLTHGWVATRGDVAVGSAVVRLVAGEGEILRLAVADAYRRQGIATRLLQVVMSAIADACPRGVYLEVRDSNVAARRLYERGGFVECGRRRGYYRSPREDAVLMRWRPATGDSVEA